MPNKYTPCSNVMNKNFKKDPGSEEFQYNVNKIKNFSPLAIPVGRERYPPI